MIQNCRLVEQKLKVKIVYRKESAHFLKPSVLNSSGVI